MFMTSNRCIPIKNTLGLSAAVFKIYVSEPQNTTFLEGLFHNVSSGVTDSVKVKTVLVSK